MEINASNNLLNKNEDNIGFNVNKQKKKQKAGFAIRQIVTYILLTFTALLCIFPFYWMLITSVKTDAEYEQLIPTMFPQAWDFSNFTDAFNYHDNLFTSVLLNSVIVGLTSTFLSLILTILAAYAFARMNFKGKNLLFTCLLMTMMIPGELFTTTNFVTTTATFGWSDTYIIMIVPFLVSVYYIYLLRNAFMQIPESLYKAAKVDGCSDFKFLIKVMIPMAAPTIISITILKLIGVWNSYMWPQLVNSQQWQLVSNWMASCGLGSSALGGVDYPMKMAAAVIMSIPLFIVFIFFRKYIMRGVSKSGTKG